jgi:hypothetical protein
MIEYKLIGKNNRPVTIDNYEDMSKIITDTFPKMPLEINKGYGFIRETRGVNGDAFSIYYRNRDTRVFIPSKDEDSIKERLEVLIGLKVKDIKCR